MRYFKDRFGDYCVSGYTWVKDHKKGPEELQLIYKTRAVYKNVRNNRQQNNVGSSGV